MDADLGKCDLIAFEGTTPFELLIRLRTWSRYSHIGFVLETHGRTAVIESTDHSGVDINPIDLYLADPKITLHWFKLRAEEFGIDRDRLAEGLVDLWGKKYPRWSQFARTWGFFSRRIGDWLGQPIDTDPDRFFCSEYGMDRLIYAGLPQSVIVDRFGRELSPAETSPDDLISLPIFDYQGRLHVD